MAQNIKQAVLKKEDLRALDQVQKENQEWEELRNQTTTVPLPPLDSESELEDVDTDLLSDPSSSHLLREVEATSSQKQFLKRDYFGKGNKHKVERTNQDNRQQKKKPRQKRTQETTPDLPPSSDELVTPPPTLDQDILVDVPADITRDFSWIRERYAGHPVLDSIKIHSDILTPEFYQGAFEIVAGKRLNYFYLADALNHISLMINFYVAGHRIGQRQGINSLKEQMATTSNTVTEFMKVMVNSIESNAQNMERVKAFTDSSVSNMSKLVSKIENVYLQGEQGPYMDTVAEIQHPMVQSKCVVSCIAEGKTITFTWDNEETKVKVDQYSKFGLKPDQWKEFKSGFTNLSHTSKLLLRGKDLTRVTVP
ncbi:hypothetical protein J6590_076829 [Homalodisca vitripennis]|nr:hypothetical protein J6590_076829 [Homalodisca vitripennis]